MNCPITGNNRLLTGRELTAEEGCTSVQILDTDVIAPSNAVTNGEFYVTHAPGTYYLKAVRFSVCTPLPADDANVHTLTVNLKVDGVICAFGQIKSGSVLADTIPAAALPCIIVLPGQRLTVSVTGAPNSHNMNYQYGLRLAQIIRLIAY
jgi:hypothetical protein